MTYFPFGAAFFAFMFLITKFSDNFRELEIYQKTRNWALLGELFCHWLGEFHFKEE